jgi:hypothetical protein
MTLSQRLSEFRFNLETLDLLNNMGKSSTQTVEMMKELGFTSEQVKFITTSRTLLNSMLLRLQLYSEQNLSETKIKTSFAMLNNNVVNSLLDTMFLQSTTTEVKASKKETVSKVVEVEEQEDELEEDDDAPVEEASKFEQFFTSCVKQTTDTTDVVKTSDFYTAFSDWWGGIYEESVPDKNELKDFLTNKLGKANKNTWSNVCLA